MDASQFDRTDPLTGKTDPNGSCFVAEASEIGLGPGVAPPSSFYFKNCPLPGMGRCFKMTEPDVSGGDIAGWRWTEEAGPNRGNTSYLNPSRPEACPPFTVLVIND